MKLTAANVKNIYVYCRPGAHEDIRSKAKIEVDGIMNCPTFVRERVNRRRADIIDMLDQLPSGFHADGGGGWSFLQACDDRDGNQWGEHPDMERLFLLGMALCVVHYLMPREDWETLPGGMPYLVVTTPTKKEESQ